MDEATRTAVQSWLFKSKRDLAAARRLAARRSPLLDAAIYHCQQAAEKAVKGFLVFQGDTFPKTHDIEVLARLAAGYAPVYGSLYDAADRLTQYATTYRYPGLLLEPNRAEYEQALQDAEVFVTTTLTLLPRKAHPVRPKRTP